EEAGIRSFHHEPAADTSQEELISLVNDLVGEDEVDGILVRLPPPDQIASAAVIAAIDPAKDVDGLTAASAGLLARGEPGLVPGTARGGVGLRGHGGAGSAGGGG